MPFVILLLVGLTSLAQPWLDATSVDLPRFFETFLPTHSTLPGRDPFFLLEETLARVAEAGSRLSLYALPAFLWFSTRLFASIRASLNQMYDVSVRPPVRRHFLVGFLLSKLRDIGMVCLSLGVVVASTVVSTMLKVLRLRGEEAAPGLAFFFSTLGRVLPELVGFLLVFTLFFVIYKYASVRRVDSRAALVASAFGAVAFEFAKRFFALYMGTILAAESVRMDFNLLALTLTVLWAYYTSLVFLLGAVVAETWQLRAMQREQRAILT